MSGGSWEYKMGHMVDLSNHFDPSNANNWSTTSTPLAKYYDSYTYNNSKTKYTRGRLGDATVEMAPTGTTGNWYSNYAYFPFLTSSWFLRGGSYGNGTGAGVFAFDGYTGAEFDYFSFRVSLGVQAS